MPFFILVGGLFLVAGGLWLRRSARRKRRRAAIEAPFPEAWDVILRENLPPYEKLSAAFRAELQNEIKVMVLEKRFEGCGGLEITDEIRVTIAAQAGMLLLNREDTGYPSLRTILVYPSSYVAGGKGLFNRDEPKSVRLGESWQGGNVVLSWSSAKHGAFNFEDGHNVVMHEFAHQLDQEDGSADGAPILEQRSAYCSWAKILSREYEKLRKRTRKGQRHVMDSYGATNPAEFFAVATETFYEKPVQMKKHHPELYQEMMNFYRVDPMEWV